MQGDSWRRRHVRKLKRAVKEKLSGIYAETLNILGVDRDLYDFYLMFLSQEIDIKLC